MRSKYMAVYALILLSLVATAVSIALSPDRVPMHYNHAGEATVLGSKYENLIIPLPTVLMGIFLLLLAKLVGKIMDQTHERIVLNLAIVVLIMFNLFFGYFLWKAVVYEPKYNYMVNVYESC